VTEGQPPTEGEDGDLTEGGDGLQDRLVPGLETHGAHLGAVQPLRRRGHPLELPLLLTEGLHDADPVEVLVDDLHDVALALLTVPRGREHPPPHPVGDDEHDRHDDDADQGEERGQVEHDTDREQHQQDVAAHDREEVEQALDEGRVGVGPADELTGGHPGELGGVHRLQMVVHGVAEVVLDLQGDPPAEVAPHVGAAEGDGRQRDEQDEPRPQRRGVLEDHAVDDLAFDQRDDRLGRSSDHGGPE
jgi:hypothetical protein